MTDTESSDRRRSARRRNRHLHQLTQKVRDGQGTLMLYSQFPDPDLRGSNRRGSFLRRPPA